MATLRYQAHIQQRRPRVPMGHPRYQKPGIRVEPRDDAMRRLLGHPQAGKFRSQGSIEWPDDQYTRRRLADGSVKRVEPAAPKQPEMQPKPTPARPVDQRRGQPQRVREAVEQVQQKKAEQQEE